LAVLLGRIEPVVQAADGGEGWRIVGVRLIRSRLVKARDRDGWQAVVDYRLRVVREG
jgi:hypothetical protein